MLTTSKLVGVLIGMLVVASACASGGESGEGITQPDPTVVPATVQETPTATSTPAEPTPDPLSVAVCPDSREHAGQEIRFDPDSMNRLAAINENCGANMSSDECPESRDNSGLTFRYDRDKVTRQAAIEEHCGGLAVKTAICPDDRQNAGHQYEYDPDDIFMDEALDQYCGMSEQQIITRCQTITENEIGQVLKGVRFLVGECFYMDVYVWQFDSNTGPCMFLGSFARFMDRGFNQERLSQFGVLEEPEAQPFATICPMLDLVFQEDHLLTYVTYLGPHTYETGAGGFNTVPAFKIEATNRSARE